MKKIIRILCLLSLIVVTACSSQGSKGEGDKIGAYQIQSGGDEPSTIEFSCDAGFPKCDPIMIAISPLGWIYGISDQNTVVLHQAGGARLREWALEGEPLDIAARPEGVESSTTATEGDCPDCLYVLLDRDGNRHVIQYNLSGEVFHDWEIEGDGSLIAVTQTGEVFVTADRDSVVRAYDPTGQEIGEWSLDEPAADIATNHLGEVYVKHNNRVIRYSADGIAQSEWETEEGGSIIVGASNRDVITSVKNNNWVVKYDDWGRFIIERELEGQAVDMAVGLFGKLYVAMANSNLIYIIHGSLPPLPESEARPHPEVLNLYLGQDMNRPHIDQRLYVGSDVTEFSFTLDITPAWPSGLFVDLFDETGMIATFDTQPAGATTIHGNSVRFVVRANGFVTLDNEGSELNIGNITILNSAPAALTPAVAQPLELGVETIGYSGAGDMLFYIDDLPPGLMYSLYLSPYSPTSTPAHDIHAGLGWTISTKKGEVAEVPERYEMLYPYTSPERGTSDTGIYEEMGVPAEGMRLYLRVDADRERFFRLTVQRVHQYFGKKDDPLVVELDGNLDGLSSTEVISTSAHLNEDIWETVYAPSVHEFIRDNTDYNDRGGEVLVIASARLLAATEGYMRFQQIRYHYGIDPLRDVDIGFGSACGRANAWYDILGPISRIALFRQGIQDPLKGAATLVHEWGHYHWWMPDEYLHDSGAKIDSNSLMGSSINFEFCGANNHNSSIPGGEINSKFAWSNITDKEGVKPPRPATSHNVSYPQNQSNYLDVLHKLESIMLIHKDQEPNTRKDSIQTCSGVGEPCESNTDCYSSTTSTCDTSVNKCIADDGKGTWQSFCTQDKQCISNQCVSNLCTRP